MNHIRRYIYVLLAIGWVFSACEKSEITAFSADPAINFEYFDGAIGIDIQKSINYSFLTNPGGEAIVEIPVIITGNAVDHDREFKVEIVQDTVTTASSEQYEIVSTTVRANHFIDTLRIKLKSSTELDDKTVGIKLRLSDSPDFQAGLIEHSEFVVTWTNKVVVPTWGVYFRTFFTNYGSSQAYRIFVETTGLTDFQRLDFSAVGMAGAEALGTAFGDYIKQYEKDHKDEQKEEDRALFHDDGPAKGEKIVPKFYTQSKFD